MASLSELLDRFEAEHRPGRLYVQQQAMVATGVLTEDLKSEGSLEPEIARAFVIESPTSGRVMVTGPAQIVTDSEVAARWERASAFNPHFAFLQGRFVEADRPNGNGAMWTSKDIHMAQGSVANGPLNWLHDELKVIGTLTDSHMVTREAAADGMNDHIVAQAAVWKFLYPRETAAIESYGRAKRLWFSMECVSESVTCVDTPGRPGCGETFTYKAAMHEPNTVCSHVRERSAIRQFNKPTFLGGAVILPPFKPGWSQADVQVQRQAAALVEEEAPEGLERGEAEAMVAQIMEYADR